MADPGTGRIFRQALWLAHTRRIPVARTDHEEEIPADSRQGPGLTHGLDSTSSRELAVGRTGSPGCPGPTARGPVPTGRACRRDLVLPKGSLVDLMDIVRSPLRVQDRPGILRRPHELPRAGHPDQPGRRRPAETGRQGRRPGRPGHAELPAAHRCLPCRAAPRRRRRRAQSPVHGPGTPPPVRGPRGRRRDRLGQGSGAGPPAAGRRRAPQYCLGGTDPGDAAAAAAGAAAARPRSPQGPRRPFRRQR